jgi:hypothetical protein
MFLISDSACWLWKRGDSPENIRITQYEVIPFTDLEYFIYKTKTHFLVIAQMKDESKVCYIQNRFMVNYIQCLKKIITEDDLYDESYECIVKKYDLILPNSDRLS